MRYIADMYNRIFTKILDSSIWLESVETRVVWITLLAAMDQDGFAALAAPGNVANRARVSLKQAESALNTLLRPDEDSSDPAHDGRRIERVPGGYMILNAPKYRSLFNREIQREQTRIRVSKHREARSVTKCNDLVTQSEAETEAEASYSSTKNKEAHSTKFIKPTEAELDLEGAKCGLPPSELQKFRDFYESNGWRVGRNPMKSWRAALRNWKRNWEAWRARGGSKGFDRTDNANSRSKFADQYEGIGKVVK